jgi:GTP-binding protein HflX
MNTLTRKEQVESNNRLFETLRTTSRNFVIGDNLRGVVIDTIGFIDNLPTELVDSFSSTLNEIETADIVLMVEDISHPQVEQQNNVAKELLTRLKLDDLLTPGRLVRVWNKIDLCTDERLQRLLEKETNKDDIVMTNLKAGVGVQDLLMKIKEKIDVLFKRKSRTLKYLYSEHDQRAKWLKE